jgi:thiamine biosynthesis lipoprotein
MPIRTEPAMGTVVTIQTIRPGTEAGIDRAFGWFHYIESLCTRFDPESELMRLSSRIGVPTPASPILFEAIRFALSVARETNGAFDPTVGQSMEARGFNRNHASGETVDSVALVPNQATYRDVQIDADRQTITVGAPLTFDLGAVAKGLAIDTAARELEGSEDFLIDAGGDIFAGGSNSKGAPWSVGIRHAEEDQIIDCVRVSNLAVCTSGACEHRVPSSQTEHHILDPRTGRSPRKTSSATVIAPGAMLADALATAAFVLGPAEGISFLERSGVEGLIVDSDLRCHETQGFRHAR